MSQNPFSIGNPFTPIITDEKTRQIIKHQGTKMMHYRKDNKCPDGWVEGSHDRDCTTCNSRSGYIFIPRPISVFYIQRDAHALYGAENVTTIAGKNERIDAEIYVKFHDGRRIQEDDIMIFSRKYGLEDIEFTVMSKKEVHGTHSRIVGWKCLLFKSPKVDILIPIAGHRL